MKRWLVAVCMFVFAGTTLAVAAPGFAGKKIVNSQIVQATKDTTVVLNGTKVFVPKGQTIILGQRDNGSLVIRGANLQNIQVNGTALTTNGFSELSYQPSTGVVFLNRGESMTVTDPAGHTVTVGAKGAVSTVDAAVNSNTVAELKAQAEAEAAQVEAELAGEIDDLPAFVEQTTTSQAATEQAVENVEEEKELSPSAPR